LTEVVLVLATGGLHLLFENVFHLKAPFIALAGLFWAGWVTVQLRRRPGIARVWGFRRDTLPAAALACGAISLVAAGGMLYIGARTARLPLPAHFWLVAPLYPVWGVIQQFLLNALLARNLATRLPVAVAVPLAAALFGMVHLPDHELAVLSSMAALAWVPIWLRWPNLWALGVSHGLLGALAYYLVLGRDVWLELTRGGTP
jgi:hypothetical protein